MPDRPNANRHEWIRIAVGRVCQLCMLVQLDGEFDDGVPCEPAGELRTSAPRRGDRS